MEINKSKVANRMSVNSISLAKESKKSLVEAPINHIFICDVSGSMSGTLHQMRKQLKNKIPSLIKDNDSTISIIWFSGRNQAGVLQEGVKVNNLLDLQKLNDNIDKFLVPIGLTGFKAPLDLALELTDRLLTSNSGSINSLLFLTDGYNNDSDWKEVISSLVKLEAKVSSSTFIEYGYYSDSNAISEMAEMMGGNKIFAENFESFEIQFEKQIRQGISSNKILVDVTDIKGDLVIPILISIQDEEVICYSTSYKKQILIPEDCKGLFYLTKEKAGEATDSEHVSSSEVLRNYYIAAYMLMEKMKYDELEEVLGSLGDISIYNEFINAYGKQKLNQFKKTLKSCIFDDKERFVGGMDSNFVPKKDAFCVMNLLSALMEEGNFFYPQHPSFSYERIGAKVEAKKELSTAEAEKLASAKTVKEVQAVMSEVEHPEFISDENQKFPLTDFVWNEERANLSIRVRYTGKVKLPKNTFGLTEVESYIFRTYTIIKDGILNLRSLPVSLTPETFNLMHENDLLEKYSSPLDEVMILEFGHLPIINRKMVERITAKELAQLEYSLIEEQGFAKVFGYYDKMHSPKANSGSERKYSKEAADWLLSIGVTDYNGFAPKGEKVDSGDSYMALSLKTKIAKLSSLPKVEDVLKKINEGKELNLSDTILNTPIKLYDSLNKADDKVELAKQVLEVKTSKVRQKREIQRSIAEIKFSLILSKKWFSDLKGGFDDNKLSMNIGGKDLDFTFDFKEEQVKL